MYLSGLWHKIIGYVMIKIIGLNCENTINYACKNAINIWDVKRLSYTCICVKTTYKGYRTLRKKFDSEVKITVVRACGLACMVRKFYFRKALFWGLIVVSSIIVSLSMFFWEIDILGEKTISEQEILSFIEDKGIKAPMLRKRGGYELIENSIEINFDQIYWADFKPRGVKLCLEVVEEEAERKSACKYTCADVVAKKDGHITKVLVFKGESIIEENKSIKKGDVIIKGEYYDEKGNYRSYLADGEVYADIWYTGGYGMCIYDEVFVRTGQYFDKEYIEILGQVGIKKNNADYEYCESEILSEDYVFKNLALPIKHKFERVYELKTVRKKKDIRLVKSEVKNKAYEIAYDQILNQDIIEEKVIFYQKDDKIEVAVFLKTNENIAEIIEYENYYEYFEQEEDILDKQEGN